MKNGKEFLVKMQDLFISNGYRNGLKFLLSLVILLGCYGCHITYKVRNQQNELVHILSTPCGTSSIELIGRGNSKFMVKQSFELDAEVQIRTDSIKVFYNDFEVLTKHNNRDARDGVMSLEKSGNLETSFEFDSGVFEGDTIKVFAPAYLRCFEHDISLDTIIYSFVNNLRIRGVNDEEPPSPP